MDYDYPREINGINLADYYPNQRSYNSVVYVHKKCIENSKKEKKVQKEKKAKEAKDKKEKKKTKSNKCDKCMQSEIDYNAEMMALNNSMMAQSLQIARNMLPLIIPPSGIISPVYYTVKASKKHKDKKKSKAETSTHTHTLKKEKTKKVIETYRNVEGKESLSVKETISYSSQSDTLDELQINPSLCCTFSEISDHKHVKKEKVVHAKHEHQKLIPSESFEALATEFLNTSGDTKIKIHLMNETEKNLITENIRVPVLHAIRDCIVEMNSQRHNSESTVQRFVKCNTQKLDNIMNKLACIEEKLDDYIYTVKSKAITAPQAQAEDIVNAKAEPVAKPKSPKEQIAMPSKLEELGEDLLEVVEDNSIAALELRQDSSGDEYYARPNLSARRRRRSAVVQLEPSGRAEKKEEGGGEVNASQSNTSQTSQLVRPERPGRIPARFCWTDTSRK